MKIWGVLVFAVAALAQYDDLGNKKPDKGPRFCGTKGNQLKDDGTISFSCKPRNGKSKHPNLTKRCKVACKTGARPCKRVFCNEKVGWIKRKDPLSPVAVGDLVCT